MTVKSTRVDAKEERGGAGGSSRSPRRVMRLDHRVRFFKRPCTHTMSVAHTPVELSRRLRL